MTDDTSRQHQRFHGNPQPFPRPHFLPHQQLSTPVFPVSPIISMSPASLRRFSHQQSNSGDRSWNESMEQLSRDLEMICKTGSRENLSNHSTASSRPSTPIGQLKIKNPMSHKIEKNLPGSEHSERRVSLNIDVFVRENFSQLKKADKNIGSIETVERLKVHRSHEDILETSEEKLPRGILKTSTQREHRESAGFEANIPRKECEENIDHVFANEPHFKKQNPDFGLREVKKIKVRHEETEVSLNRNLAKICRSKNIMIVQTSETSTHPNSNLQGDKSPDNFIENELQKLSAPVVFVGNIQQLFHQRQGVAPDFVQSGETSRNPNNVENELREDVDAKENENDKMLRSAKQSKPLKVIQDTNRKNHAMGASMQAYKQKKLMRLSQGGKSLGRSLETVGIRLRVDLSDRNPYSIGVSVDEETGFLAVFALTFTRNPSHDSGYGETFSVGGNSSCHKPSISSDASEVPTFVHSVEQLHLLRIGESTKAERLRCSIEDGLLRIREVENEAEFLSFDGASTKFLPVFSEDFSDCRICVTLFVPQEFRNSLLVKTIDNILVLSGVKGHSSDKFGSSQDFSDDDDGYEAASEKSSYSSLTFTPPTSSSFQPQTLPTGRGSSSSVSSSTQPLHGLQTFKVALSLPPETITRTIEAWVAECGQLIVIGQTTGVGRRMTCNF